MIILINLYLAKINKKMCMQLMVIIKFQSCKSESILVNKKSQSIICFESKLFCKVAQLQKIAKNAKILLASFENRLKKNSFVFQKMFSYKNFLKIMIKYNDVISNTKLIKKLDFKLYNILSDPCFLFVVYSSLRKDVVNKNNNVERMRTFKSYRVKIS